MTRRTPGRTGRTGRTAHRRPVRAALLCLVTVAALAACTTSDPAPARTSAPSASSAASSAPPASAEPTPTATTTALTFHPEGRIDDFPPNAPEADVVAHLTERLGAAPETLDAEHACEPAGEPGRLLAWPGLRLFVLTNDPEGGATDPYVAGWALDGEGGAPVSATAEGLRIGDPEERIAELYPSAVSAEPESQGERWWHTRDAGGFTVIASGEGAGSVVAAIGSGFLCTAS